MPGVLALVIFASLLVMPEARLANALPLLVPLALLAGLEVDSLKRGFSGALDWFGILTFGLLAVVMWGFWIDAYVNGMPGNVARLFRDTEVGYQPSFHLGTMLAAIGLTVLWVMLVRPARRSNRRAILNWAAGVTLIWGLVTDDLAAVSRFAPQLPLDGGESSRCACRARQLPREPQPGRAAARAVRLFLRHPHRARRGPTGARLRHGCWSSTGGSAADPEPPEGWTPIWSGARRGDDTERFVLYKRTP